MNTDNASLRKLYNPDGSMLRNDHLELLVIFFIALLNPVLRFIGLVIVCWELVVQSIHSLWMILFR